MTQANLKRGVLTAPNCFTLLRMVAALPVAVGLALAHDLTPWIIVWFVLAATDALDGRLARWWHQESIWGKFLDPLADKLLFYCGAGSLAYRWYQTTPAVAVVFALATLLIGRLDLISTLDYVRSLRRALDPSGPRQGAARQSNWFGRAKTLVLLSGLLFGFVDLDRNHQPGWLAWLVVFTALALGFALAQLSLIHKRLRKPATAASPKKMAA